MVADESPVKPFFLDLTPDEIEEAKEALGTILATGQLILGPHTERFEAACAARFGVEHAVSVNSGTAALEVLLRAHDAAGKRIAVPTNTNFATVAAIIRVGAQPVFLDMTPDTFMPELAMLAEAHEREPLAGAIWVHIGGLIAPDFADIVGWTRERGVFLLEDAAHAHGSRMHGTEAGAFADGGAFSFFPTKVMTTMEGGLVTTNDRRVADLARSLRNQGKGGAKFGNHHTDLGYSWRMPEIAAVIGEIQLRKLDAMLERRAGAAKRIAQALRDIGAVYCDWSHMDCAAQYKLIVRLEDGDDAESAKARLKGAGVIAGGGVYETPCHLQPVFRDVPLPRGGLPNAERWCPRHLCPPLTSGMTDSDIERVCAGLRTCLTGAQA